MHHHRGSIWTKWDLHFHTPASYDYQDKGITNQQIIDTLIDNDIRVVAITDHHTMDVSRIRELQEFGGDRLTVLPGIELRSELGGSESVHFIGIFAENADLEYLWGHLSAGINLMPQDIEAAGGNDAVFTDFKDAAKVIKDLGGIVTVHAGKKSNSIENIRNTEYFKMIQKKRLVFESVDILEIGRVQDQATYENTVFPSIDIWLPLIIGSDNHRVTDYQLRAPCWIKADPCFAGLRQVIIEPQDRVYIGDQPPKLELVLQQPARFIQGIRINKKDTATLDEIWFDRVELKFNHNLIAIIGNKGTGKSALSDILALMGNTKNHDHFSFLNRNRFRAPNRNRADQFEATLRWENNRSSDSTSLNKNIERTASQTVKYIPQGLFEEICTELEIGDTSRFDHELQQVIFSHVPPADRLGKDTLEALIAYKTEQTDDAIEALKTQLADINEEIVALEEKLKPEHHQQLQNQLIAKEEELADHNARQPAAVAPPTGQSTPEAQEVARQLEAAEQEKRDLEAQIQAAQKQEAEEKVKVAVANRALDGVTNFRQQFQKFKEALSTELQQLGLSFEDLVTLTINKQPIEQKQTEAQQLVDAAIAQLDANRPNSLVNQLTTMQRAIQALQNKLDEPNRLYQQYVNEQQRWQQRRAEIVGTADQKGSLEYFKARLAELDEIPAQLTLAQQNRIELVKQIYAKIQQLAETYSQLYQPVQRFINDHPAIQETLQLNFAVSIVNINLHTEFFDWIARNVVGSFYGTAEGDKVLNNLIKSHDLNQEAGMLAFLDDLKDHLTHDKRAANTPATEIQAQLKKGKNLNEFYDYIYSLEYLRPRYMLQMAGKQISELSPGERGALLIIFYLLIDRDQSPLIIDQPEENLDNQTVYELLVKAIKEAKKHRQIIIVTHNPNLAVVCDAEQVICCDIDKQNGNKITYTSGSIENPEINKKIVDILEGTMPAFDNRRSKYERPDRA